MNKMKTYEHGVDGCVYVYFDPASLQESEMVFVLLSRSGDRGTFKEITTHDVVTVSMGRLKKI
jgi:hypothetical protein